MLIAATDGPAPVMSNTAGQNALDEKDAKQGLVSLRQVMIVSLG